MRGRLMKISIYTRQKNDKGRWRYERVNIGRGRRPANLQGPFYFRHTTPEGKQTFTPAGDDLDNAIKDTDILRAALEAKSKGLTITELDDLTNANRIPIKTAVQTYLELKSNMAKKTVAQYRLTLNEFVESLSNKTRFLDEISDDTLRGYKKFMESKGFAGKTVDTRLNITYFMLKKNGIKARLPKDEMPIVEEEDAVPYTNDELEKLFAAMTPEENIRYKFFLGTACRDKEVTFAAWQDIDFTKATYHVRKKEDVGFTPKSHESRIVPMPASLVALLKARHRHPAHPRWIFVNNDGKPDNHFLRKLKRIALRAGLNCGQCKTTVTKGKYDRKREVEVTCETDPVCEHWYLHRLRKTCATRWHENGIPVRKIQKWLGHKNLETTALYLGDMADEKLRGQMDTAFGD
jgi:integrase/recombinase XerD